MRNVLQKPVETQQEGGHLNAKLGHTLIWTSATTTLRNTSVLFKPPCLWYFDWQSYQTNTYVLVQRCVF